MKKFTVASLAKKIEADNEKFNSANKAEQRVIIAEDCLIRIELQQIEPKSGTFCKIIASVGSNVKSVLNTTKTQVCTSCAKGSLFMSYVGRVNNYNSSSITMDNSLNDIEHIKLLEIFSIEQLALIETFFEGKQYIDLENDLSIHFDKIIEIRKKIAEDNNLYIQQEHNQCYIDTNLKLLDEEGNPEYDTYYEAEKIFNNALMVYICNNIIENQGTFTL